MIITKDTTIEELVDNVPGAVKYLMEQGIRCIVCGEPIWGTLEDAALEKGFNQNDIEKFVKDLNELLEKGPQEEEVKVETKIEVKKIDLEKDKKE